MAPFVDIARRKTDYIAVAKEFEEKFGLAEQALFHSRYDKDIFGRREYEDAIWFDVACDDETSASCDKLVRAVDAFRKACDSFMTIAPVRLRMHGTPEVHGSFGQDACYSASIEFCRVESNENNASLYRIERVSHELYQHGITSVVYNSRSIGEGQLKLETRPRFRKMGF